MSPVLCFVKEQKIFRVTPFHNKRVALKWARSLARQSGGPVVMDWAEALNP